MKKLNWGMLGTGWIAHEMGEALQRVNGEIYACCARSIESAEKYAKEVVSLPMFYGITSEDVDRVIKAVNEYEPKRVLKR